jgi:oligopeptide transport system permease protein
MSVRLKWNALPNAFGYRVYRNIFPIGSELAYGIPLAEFFDNAVLFFEDRLDLKPRRYYYSVVPMDENGSLIDGYQSLAVDPIRVTTLDEAASKGLLASRSDLQIGDSINLSLHPLGTDYLGRDMLARLMEGARVSLFIGIGAPIFFILFGIFYGSVAGFLGGRVDQILMRIADFVVALPFLLFMILFKIAFGIGPGESGIFPMLVALVVLMWPSTARLVRGQILQIREQGYIGASQLLGAKTNYLIFRHMLPNTLGVVLVTITFAIPSAIFIEAFLSFIGMGVAPPTPSWGSMSNEGIKNMLTSPHELILPAILISITVLAFNLLGDGMRDALDARLRNQE